MDFKERLSSNNYTETLLYFEILEREGVECINTIKNNIGNSSGNGLNSFCNGWDEMFFHIKENKEKIFEIKDKLDLAEMNLNHYEEYMDNLENDIKNKEVFTKGDILEIEDDLKTMLKTTPTLLKDTEKERSLISNNLKEKVKGLEKRKNIKIKFN
jgi:hypothetical protein